MNAKYHIYLYRTGNFRNIGILLIFLLSGMLYVQNTFSQTPILDSEVRLTAHTTTVEKLLDELGKAGGFSFSFGKEVPLNKQITVTSEKKSIREHLEEIFEDDSLMFIEKGKKVLIVLSLPSTKNQIPEQTIRGRILDLDSKTPLIGVNVILSSDGPLIGTITDEAGIFRFEGIPVGRHELKCSYVGYQPEIIPNLIVGSGKENVLNIEMEESAISINEVKITSNSNQSQPVNNLTVISGRSFSAYEVENYPGSFSDISRTAVSFPGVVSTNDGQNHIVIRGNSPKGMQWRLEGIEIPNLNHFADVGASGGGVNVVSNNMLASSDFISSAFSAEYGNALSGIFDLRMRTGNNEKHEQTIQVGMIGTEAMVEGPINKSTNTTYIAQYRYATFKLIQKMGIYLPSVPDFQDLSFKIYHPTKRLGVFSLFGIGGLSHETGQGGYSMNSNMATVGLTNNYTINHKTFIRTTLSVSGRKYSWDNESEIGTFETPINQVWNTDVTDYTARGSLTFNRKINSKHKLKAGLIYEMAFNESFIGWYSDTLYNWYSNPNHAGFLSQNYEHFYVDSKDHAGTLQTFINWKYRLSDAFTINTGLHFIQFYLNNNYSLEPRASLQWKVHPSHILSAGFGIHSRKESMTLYLGEYTLFDGTVISPNLDLELAKARHYVLGYNYLISDFLNLKTEIYYQDLYDIPAYPFPPYFTTLNFDFGFEGNILTNYGTGYNTGIEVSLEKHMSNGYYFMLNGTLYESKYRNKMGELLHTKYDGTYASNGLFGKEFKVGKGKQHVISLNARYILAGGLRYLPIDKEASIAQGSQVRIWDNGFSEKSSDYLRIDLMLKFRRNTPRHTGEWSIDMLNILNRQNMLTEYWDNSIADYNTEYQNPFILLVNYRIQF